MQPINAASIQRGMNSPPAKMRQGGRTTLVVQRPPQPHRSLSARVRPIEEDELPSVDPALRHVPPQEVEDARGRRQQVWPGLLAVQTELARRQQLDTHRRARTTRRRLWKQYHHIMHKSSVCLSVCLSVIMTGSSHFTCNHNAVSWE